MSITDDTENPSAVLATFIGEDRPGLAAQVFSTLAALDVTVADVEESVVTGKLVLALVLVPVKWENSELLRLRAILGAAGDGLGLEVTVREVQQSSHTHTHQRVARCRVVMMATRLSAQTIAQVSATAQRLGANVEHARRLTSGDITAVEYIVSGSSTTEIRAALKTLTTSDDANIAVVPVTPLQWGKRLVIMDVDSTLITGEVIEMLAAHAGTLDTVRHTTDKAMRGEIDFATSLQERVATLAGLPQSVIDDVQAEVKLTPGVQRLCRVLNRMGFPVALVSGGFADVIKPIAQELKISHLRANRLEIVDGHLTGKVTGPIVDRQGKAAALREFAEHERIPLGHTVAIGDGANDLDMLALAGLGVAFNAKPIVRQQADTALNTDRLDPVLYYLGLTDTEIAELLAE